MIRGPVLYDFYSFECVKVGFMAQDEAGLGECSVGAGEECVLRLPIESSIRVNQAWLRTVLSSLTHPD